jgi:hypothetical protein
MSLFLALKSGYLHLSTTRDQADEVKNPGQDFKANKTHLLTVRRRKAEGREGEHKESLLLVNEGRIQCMYFLSG